MGYIFQIDPNPGPLSICCRQCRLPTTLHYWLDLRSMLARKSSAAIFVFSNSFPVSFSHIWTNSICVRTLSGGLIFTVLFNVRGSFNVFAVYFAISSSSTNTTTNIKRLKLIGLETVRLIFKLLKSIEPKWEKRVWKISYLLHFHHHKY